MFEGLEGLDGGCPGVVGLLVAVDDERKPVAVPVLHPNTADERRRHAAAEMRKQLRQEFGKRFEALRGSPSHPEQEHPA